MIMKKLRDLYVGLITLVEHMGAFRDALSKNLTRRSIFSWGCEERPQGSSSPDGIAN